MKIQHNKRMPQEERVRLESFLLSFERGEIVPKQNPAGHPPYLEGLRECTKSGAFQVRGCYGGWWHLLWSNGDNTARWAIPCIYQFAEEVTE